MTEEVVRDSPQGCLYNHAHATLILPCENNKYVFFKSYDLTALLHKSVDFWEYYCYLCFPIRKTESTGLCSAGSQSVCALGWWGLIQGRVCSALLGRLHCSSWGKQGTSDFSRTDGFRGLLRRQWLRAGNSGWKDLNGDETILFMIKGPKQCQSCGKWISVYLTPDLSWDLVPHKHLLLGAVHPK